jgi:hypothetical protein
VRCNEERANWEWEGDLAPAQDRQGPEHETKAVPLGALLSQACSSQSQKKSTTQVC